MTDKEKLEEAARRECRGLTDPQEIINCYCQFIRGANWQKEQMMKDAVPYFVLRDYDSHGADYGLGIIHIRNNVLEPRNIKPDDAVDIIIIKRDKR